MSNYIVTAPYIVPKVRDALGSWVHRGFYRDAVIKDEDIDPASLQHHLDGDMMAPLDAPAAVAEPPVLEPEAPEAPVGQPPTYASKGAWVDYAVSKRAEDVSEDDARAAAEAKSKAELITEYGS